MLCHCNCRIWTSPERAPKRGSDVSVKVLCKRSLRTYSFVSRALSLVTTSSWNLAARPGLTLTTWPQNEPGASRSVPTVSTHSD
ncbi:hypothetical protein SCLCIDRAFT_1221543 [Scleroderma citrinum Foug A]|uniref:Uncharacterized protein n=1 Tax=Scleroderma citrinum Foug A TaxID=1036808 RepID=A0A0C3DFR4_9AGAM|nr:hypothetical protein SCLCIDRAFT_1221543 [Scleroderma citrinum Foug A]